MNLAIIGPGIMTVPPKSWGAIETIIWNHSLWLRQMGHTVTLFNSPDLEEVARQVNKGQFDFVHVQYDAHAAYFQRHLERPFVMTSHYGYLPQVQKWDDAYREIFFQSLEIPGIIALSAESAEVYNRFGFSGSLKVLRNGVEAGKFAFLPQGNGKAVCVGNIVPRKRQALVAKALRNRVEVDFYGPNFKGGEHIPEDVVTLLPGAQMDFFSLTPETEFAENETALYKGIWKREELYQNLTRYSCLVLISESENDPLVVKEALAAGLSVVVSQGSAANLTDEPFIYVLSEEEIAAGRLAATVQRAIAENPKHRHAARNYAFCRFDYPVVTREYLRIIRELTQENIVPPVVKEPANIFNSQLAFS